MLVAATTDVSAVAHGVEVKGLVDGGGHPGRGQAGVSLLHVVPHNVVMAGQAVVCVGVDDVMSVCRCVGPVVI